MRHVALPAVAYKLGQYVYYVYECSSFDDNDTVSCIDVAYGQIVGIDYSRVYKQVTYSITLEPDKALSSQVLEQINIRRMNDWHWDNTVKEPDIFALDKLSEAQELAKLKQRQFEQKCAADTLRELNQAMIDHRLDLFECLMEAHRRHDIVFNSDMIHAYIVLSDTLVVDFGRITDADGFAIYPSDQLYQYMLRTDPEYLKDLITQLDIWDAIPECTSGTKTAEKTKAQIDLAIEIHRRAINAES